MSCCTTQKPMLLPEAVIPQYLENKTCKSQTGYYKKLLAQHTISSNLWVLIDQRKPCRYVHVPYGD